MNCINRVVCIVSFSLLVSGCAIFGKKAAKDVLVKTSNEQRELLEALT